MANADSIAYTTNKEQCCSLASTVSPNIALHSAASRQQCSLARVVSANTLQRNPPTLGNIDPWPTPSPSTPQRIQPTLSDNATRPTPTLMMLQRIWPTLWDVALWPMRPVGAACQPCWPKPLLTLQLPVNAAPPQVPRMSSSLAHIANLQEQPCVAVAAKSGGRAGCGGGSSNAIGRWSGRPPSIGQEQCIYTLHRMMVKTTRSDAQVHNISMLPRTTATTTRPRVKAHDIYMLRRTMAMTTRPRAQAHDIYTLRCTTAMMTRPRAQMHAIFNVALHDSNKDNKKTAVTTPYVDYKPNSARAVSYRASHNGIDNNKNGNSTIVFHIVLRNGDDDNNELRH
jgi:hypothetical protein